MGDFGKDQEQSYKPNRREFCVEIAKVAGTWGVAGSLPSQFLGQTGHTVAPENTSAFSSLSSELIAGWLNPAHTYRPHTRWWWPGNAVTRDGIAWELEQMHQQGMGGVEIMSPWRMYAKGNIPYLSKEFLEMVKFAIETAERQGMEVAITFSPGWSFGGFWVPETQRSKVLTRAWIEVSGPKEFHQQLPEYTPPANSGLLDSGFRSSAPDEEQIVAVVAGKISGDRLEASSLIDLTSRVERDLLHWEIPSGHWRIMVFRLKYTGQLCQTTDNFPRRQWVLDHFSKVAVRNYCDYLGETYYEAFGEQFGRTLDTFFCDSFEIMVFPGTIHWSNAALDEFKAFKGYDLTPYLPAVWWDIGELTPRIRYDVNDFLGWLGLDATFLTFIDWCGKHNVEARIQPHYRFTEEIIQGAGLAPRPEMEVTTDRFAVVMNPRKQVAAGGHLYGRRIISAESYTFLHTERYRTTLEQMKGATDAFLRDGVTQFYNHGYIYSPEMHVAPSRDMPWANRISHWNVWWKYYHHLTEYVSRCCFLLRQGEFAGDVMIYSPQSTVWTETVLFDNNQRVMPFGDVGKALVANGYDFDPVNDDVLQHRAEVDKGRIKVRDLRYRFLIMPRTTAVPVPTMEFIREFVLGGGVVIALDELPAASVGLENAAQNDARVKEIVTELFGPAGQGKAHPGGGHTYYFAGYKIPTYQVEREGFTPFPRPYELTPPLTAPQQALLGGLREHLAPDFMLAGNEQSNGLTFLHRRLGADDIYFVTNLQPKEVRTSVTFRASGKTPEEWNPLTGRISPVFVYKAHAEGLEMPIRLEAFASTFYIFRSGEPSPHLSETNLEEVRELGHQTVRGIAGKNGEIHVTVVENGQSRKGRATVTGLPEPLPVSGTWKMVLEGHSFQKLEKQVSHLQSWTEDLVTMHFSGTGSYMLDFHVPHEYVGKELESVLDLGIVGNIAEVTLNGRPVGVAWMQPYRLDVTEALESGSNHLEILVTNTLINYVAGMKEMPKVPAELIPHYGPTVDIYHEGRAEWERREKDFQPLSISGLIGPVRIIARRQVTVHL